MRFQARLTPDSHLVPSAVASETVGYTLNVGESQHFGSSKGFFKDFVENFMFVSNDSPVLPLRPS